MFWLDSKDSKILSSLKKGQKQPPFFLLFGNLYLH